jgi:AP-3 complex subunit sigma
MVINNHGQPRLTRFYPTVSPSQSQELIAEAFTLVNKRSESVCNFLESKAGGSFGAVWGEDVRLIYRHYATLYFIFAVDKSESELGILDLIQVLLPF